jgi:hypothetical protein
MGRWLRELIRRWKEKRDLKREVRELVDRVECNRTTLEKGGTIYRDEE